VLVRRVGFAGPIVFATSATHLRQRRRLRISPMRRGRSGLIEQEAGVQSLVQERRCGAFFFAWILLDDDAS